MKQDIIRLLNLYNQGQTLKNIGDALGISKQRVQQLLVTDPRYIPRPKGWTRKSSETVPCLYCSVHIPRYPRRKYCPKCKGIRKVRKDRMSDDKVIAIYKDYYTIPNSTYKLIAALHNVSMMTVWQIINHKTRTELIKDIVL